MLASTLRNVALVVVVFGFGTGCAPLEESEPWDDTDAEIVDGQVATGDPAVVALTIQGQSFCSGTLITPTVVLTAAHCLPPHVPYPTNQIRVFFGTTVPNGQMINVTESWVHPGWHQQAQYDDIGMVRLAQTAPTAPMPMATGTLLNGISTRVIGFGQTSANGGGSGTKRHGVMHLSQQDARLLVLNPGPSKTCFGDSGGTNTAVLNGVETLIGINSRSENCVGVAIETRVSGYQADIQNFTGVTPPPNCGSDGQCATGCPAVDPDCPCAGDGFCGACPDPNNDPDCAPCGADGFCDPSCGNSDPDCGGPTCAQDGFCDPACNGADPDCGGEDCSQNGQCNPNCGASDPDCGVACGANGVCGDCPTGPDPDCWTPGNQGKQDYDDGETIDGCSVTQASAGSTPPSGALLALAAALGLSLRRRND